LLLHLQQLIVEVQAAFASTFGAAATLARDCHRFIETQDRIQELFAVKGSAAAMEEFPGLVAARPPCLGDELQSRVAAIEALCTNHEVRGVLAAVRPAQALQKALAQLSQLAL